MKCEECGKELKSFKSLTTHIQFKHNNEQHNYYDKWFKKNVEGFCKFCRKPTKFDSMHYGYQTYCSKMCMSIHYTELKRKNNPMHTDSAKLNQRNTNLKRYGVTQNTKRPEIKNKIKKTNLEKYGVENVSQNELIKAKSLKHREETNLKRYGVKSVFAIKEFIEKIKKTNLKKYGSEYATQSSIVKDKTKKTNKDRYGVEYVSQNKDIFNKQQKKQYGANIHDCGLYYRGSFEKDFLNKFSSVYTITQGPPIKYFFMNKFRIYYPDFYIPKINLIVEIKNSWLAIKNKDMIAVKTNACKTAGYNYIIIINKDYTEFKKLYIFK